jgi:carboxyl-terminal processing protease
MNAKKSIWTVAMILLALFAGFIAGLFAPQLLPLRRFIFDDTYKIDAVLDIISQDYVDEVNIASLTETVLPKITGELDPHTVYIPADELNEVQEDIDGEFAGIGVEYIILSDTIVVLNTVGGGPAQQAGIMSGDRIIAADNFTFIGVADLEEATRKTLRGNAGTSVNIQIKRPGTDSVLSYNIIRQYVPVTTVKAAYRVAEGTGLIKIYDCFSANTYSEFINAMAKLLNLGCTKFIVDLRGNGGGVMDAAVNICNELLPAQSIIVYAEGRAFPRQLIQANGLGTLQNNPIVVLVDQFSASASEIIAGAVQDNDRGLIIGRRTFGKGLIQNQIILPDSSALRLTVARYFTPSGRNIQRKYEMGKTDEYNNEWLERFSNGEEFEQDSVKQDETMLFHTKQGREVYGGGGITPDIFIPLDTASLTSYFISLNNKNIFRQFAGTYADINRARLNAFKTYTEMWDYLKTQPLLYELTHFAEQYGIKRRTNLINASANSILRITYAHILQNFFGEEIFFIVYLEGDTMIKKAVEILNDN